MLTLESGLPAAHDLRLLLVAGLVCFVGLLMTLRLFARAAVRDSRQAAWVAISAIAAGATVWAAHFVAITAYQPALHSGYDSVRTTFAFMTALAGMTASFWAATDEARPWRSAMAGGLFGIGVTAALSAGVNAFQTQGVVVWNPVFLLLSTPVGVGLATAGFVAGRDLKGWKRQAMAAGLLFAAFAAVDIIGMAGLSVIPDPSIVLSPHLIAPEMLALMVTLVAGLTIAGGFAVIDTDQTQLRALDQVRLREIIDAVPEAVGYCDAEDRLIFWNRQYADLGRHSHMAVEPGTPFVKVLRGALANGGYRGAIGREEEWLAERMAQHAADHSVHEHALNDGRWLRIEERRTADGGVIMVCVDITDLKRDAQVLSDARDEAMRANRAKSEFLANMSHEIRTPLNGVIGLTDVLARTDLNVQQREIVEIVRASGATLERLLTDVLDLARIESGRLEIRREAFHLGDVVRQVAGLAELRARDKGVAFDLCMNSVADMMVEGDPDRLKQILLNLLSNAVKFTGEGVVELTVEPVALPSGQTFRFDVRDTGVGFSMEDKTRLFQRFEQADGSITRQFGGSGLGLAIAYELATVMGGSMDAEGVAGEGATFTVILPLPAAQKREPAPAVRPVEVDQDSRVMRVLLAEDHPTNRRVVELMLETTGAALTSVENGEQAVEAFRAGEFDIVLMDMQMPVMDGLAAIRAIRADERNAGRAATPIVALTANALPEHVRASADAGADAHRAKPITAATLIPAMQLLLAGVEVADAASRLTAA